MKSMLMRWLFCSRVQQLEDLALDRHVERGRRLVGDQQLGLAGQRHRDHHPLLLAAGELVRIGAEPALRPPGMPTSLSSASARSQAARRDSPHVLDQRLDELLADGEHRVQRAHRVLEDAGDLLAAERLQLARFRRASRSRSCRPWCQRMRPLRSALSGSRLSTDIAVTLLPEPDSPTRATVAFSGRRTTRRGPRRRAALRPCGTTPSGPGWTAASPRYSRPRSFGSSASRAASAISENAVTKTAMNSGRGGELPPVAEDQLGLRLGEHRAPADRVDRNAQARGTKGSPRP